MLRPVITTLSNVAHGAYNYQELDRLGLSPDQIIDFSANSNPYGPHPSVLQAVQEAVTASTLIRYPDRDCLALREAIAQFEGTSLKNVLPGNGANELIQLVALAAVAPNSRHMVLSPTFGEYTRVIRLMGGEVYEHRPTSERETFRFTESEVVEAIQQWQPDGIWLCNPNNPTGQWWTPEELNRLRSADPEQKILWIVDESYHHFISPSLQEEYQNKHRWVEDDNLIRIRSLTKDHSLAGLRLGYLLAAPPLIRAIKLVQPSWSVNSLAQIAGIAAFQKSVIIWREQSLIELNHQATQLWSDLTELGFTVLPTATSYALVAAHNATQFRHKLLIKGILVRDCTSFGLPHHIRLAAQLPTANQQLLMALKNND